MSHSHRAESDEHDHHGHSHAPVDFGRAFLIGIVLNTGFVLVELAFGIVANFVAAVAGGRPNFRRVVWPGGCLVGRAVGEERATRERTYGFKRASILAALANAAFLLVALGAIALEAIRRFTRPEPVQS